MEGNRIVANLLYIVFGFLELTLSARVILLLLGANSANPLVDWIYGWSEPFASPFAGIFGQHITVAGQGVVTTSVFDWTTLIALIVYALIGGILIRLLGKYAID